LATVLEQVAAMQTTPQEEGGMNGRTRESIAHLMAFVGFSNVKYNTKSPHVVCLQTIKRERRWTTCFHGNRSCFLGQRQSFIPTPLRRRFDLKMTAQTKEAGSEAKEKTFEFQAEVSRVMDIIIHSLYSHKDIFLRELVSNASDACDKRRFLSVSGGSAADNLEIRVQADKEKKQLIISDTGVGMTEQELINNLGKIAESGTSKFVEALGQGKADVSLIGKFGVGFYSAFLVADKVEVTSRSLQSDKTYRWESHSAKNYTVSEAPEPLESCGTRIVLHLRDDSEEFLEPFRLEQLLKKYSEYISFPIYLWKSRTEFEETEEPKEGEETATDSEKKAEKRRVPKTVWDWELVNKNKPIWMRKPSEVTKEEYEEFYKSIAHAYEEPLAYSHFSAEGEVEFRSVIFVPKSLPFELSQDMFSDQSKSIRLYVRRVFISDSFTDLFPRWLTFIRGVVDSEDLPLNVSREILQQSRVARIIRKKLVRKTVDMFQELSKRDNNDYETFWTNFGKYIKVGVLEEDDRSIRDELTRLCRFFSSKSGDKMTSLDDYVSRMKPTQKQIFYVTAESLSAARSLPIIEKLKSLDYEVLFLSEPVDEFMIGNIPSFKGKREKEENGEKKQVEEEFRLVNVGKEGETVDLPELKEEKPNEETSKELEPLTKWMSELLGKRVSKVVSSSLLTDSPCAVVQSRMGISPTMERFLRAQKGDSDRMSAFMEAPVLELNPKHSVVRSLLEQVKKHPDSSDTRDLGMLLYETALLTCGYSIEEPSSFAKRVSHMMNLAFSGNGRAEEHSNDSTATSIETPQVEVVQDGNNT
jgi:heat shock protein beta